MRLKDREGSGPGGSHPTRERRRRQRPPLRRQRSRSRASAGRHELLRKGGARRRLGPATSPGTERRMRRCSPRAAHSRSFRTVSPPRCWAVRSRSRERPRRAPPEPPSQSADGACPLASGWSKPSPAPRHPAPPRPAVFREQHRRRCGSLFDGHQAQPSEFASRESLLVGRNFPVSEFREHAG